MELVESPYTYLAGIGVLLIGTQLLMSFMKFSKQPGLHHDPFGYRGANAFHDLLLKLRPGSVALLLAGLFGMAGTAQQWPEPRIRLAAYIAGFLGFVLAVFLPVLLQRLSAAGETLDGAVGQRAVVLKLIPGQETGQGLVKVMVDGRVRKCLAVTPGKAQLPGSPVSVTSLASPDVLVVMEVGKDDNPWKTFLQKSPEAAKGPEHPDGT